MNSTRQTLFCLLLNSSIAIAVFAAAVAALAPLLSKLKARTQHALYLGVIALSWFAPLVNTLPVGRDGIAPGEHIRSASDGERKDGHFAWYWHASLKAEQLLGAREGVEVAVLCMWAALTLYGTVQFARALRRVSFLRSSAMPFDPHLVAQARLAANVPERVKLLESPHISDPVTVGHFRPAILLPSGLLSQMEEAETRALLLHECAHIRRRDYLVHVASSVACIPMHWHPGMQYLMNKVSQTRELVCDEDAALNFSERRQYARALVRLASLCLAGSQSNALGLCFFNADNLEDRIMKLTTKQNPLTRFGLSGLALAAILTFGSGAVLVRATSLHAQPATPNANAALAGTWHWMFKEHSFATMVLVPNGPGFTGSVTGSRIALDDSGNLSKADASENASAVPISKTAVQGGGLRVTVMDGGQPFEFVVTLRDANHADIMPVGAPPNMKPIQAERVS